MYWLDLLFQTDYLTEEQYRSVSRDALELRKMLTASTKTMHTRIHTISSSL